MPEQTYQIELIIVLGTTLAAFFVLTFVLMFAIFNKRKQLHQREKEIISTTFQQTLLQAQLEIQEQTFTSISQEIHDNVGQVLSLAKVQLNIIDQQQETEKSLLNEAKENISKALTDLRDIAKGLSSDRIRVIGLATAVQQEAERINRTGTMSIRLHTSGADRELNGQKQLILFRVIQECFQNIIKHAAASLVTVRFQYAETELYIDVADNGKGFKWNEAELPRQSLGIRNIFKRLESIGGKASIHSAPGEGTTIKLIIAYE